MIDKILLGFEAGSGEPVHLPLHHLAIFGITQLSGKTTTLEALISRSGLKAIAFITKRGEAGFTKFNLIPPYYKPRADWQFVEGLVNVALGEKVKYEPGMRWAIIKVSKGAKNLRDVKAKAEEMLAKAKRDFQKQLFEKLITYLEIVVPELEQWSFSERLELSEGVNVMDLSGMRLETQHLVIASTIDYAFQNLDHVVVIVPEAWETLPQNKMTPVKWVAQQFIRKGAAIGNYLWLDSFPSYETLLVKINGNVNVVNFEQLWELLKTPRNVESDGYEEKLTPETEVYTLCSGKSRLEWVKIKKLFRHPYKGDVLRINTVKGVVDLSPNHPVMKYPRYLTNAENLKIGDRLCMRDFQDRILSDKGLFVGTEGIAWLYGFFAAEGWVSANDHVCFSNKDRALLEKVAEILEECFHHSATLLKPRKGVYTLDVNSPLLAKHFREKCYASQDFNSRNKVVPVEILNAPKKIKQAFLEGYLAGDGYYRRGQVAGFSSVSRRLILGLLWLIHSTSNQRYSVHCRDDKIDAIQIILNKTNTRKGSPDQIKKIRRFQYEGWLYDLEVDNLDHTFNIGVGNFRVKNSQDIGGIDKTPLRQCDNWLMGRMKEAHEVERILKQLLGMKVKAEEIQTLPLGHFYAAIGNEVRKVYVLPAGVPGEVGREVALGKRSPESVRDSFLKPKTEVVELVWKEKYEQLEKQFADIRTKLYNELKAEFDKQLEQYEKTITALREWRDKLQERIGELETENANLQQRLESSEKIVDVFSELIRGELERLGFEPSGKALPSQVTVQHEVPALTVQVIRKPLVLSTDSAQGRLALLYAEGFFDDEERTISIVQREMMRRGWPKDPRLSGFLDEMCSWGYLRKRRTDRWLYQAAIKSTEAKEKGLLKEVEV